MMTFNAAMEASRIKAAKSAPLKDRMKNIDKNEVVTTMLHVFSSSLSKPMKMNTKIMIDHHWLKST